MEVEAGGPFVAGNPTKALSRSLTDGSLESGSPSIPSVEFNSLARKEQYEQERKNKALMKAAAKIADAGVGENQDSPKNSIPEPENKDPPATPPKQAEQPPPVVATAATKGPSETPGVGSGKDGQDGKDGTRDASDSDESDVGKNGHFEKFDKYYFRNIGCIKFKDCNSSWCCCNSMDLFSFNTLGCGATANQVGR